MDGMLLWETGTWPRTQSAAASPFYSTGPSPLHIRAWGEPCQDHPRLHEECTGFGGTIHMVGFHLHFRWGGFRCASSGLMASSALLPQGHNPYGVSTGGAIGIAGGSASLFGLSGSSRSLLISWSSSRSSTNRPGEQTRGLGGERRLGAEEIM